MADVRGGCRAVRPLERMNSPLGQREVRLRGLLPRARRAPICAEMADGRFLGRAVVFRSGEGGAALPRNDRFSLALDNARRSAIEILPSPRGTSGEGSGEGPAGAVRS